MCTENGESGQTALDDLAWRYDPGSDIHVMLALRRSPRQVIVTNKQLNGTDMVGELLRA
jgi:hypothetical protein